MSQWERICLPMQELQVPSLGREDPLEQEMATHSSILAWKISWVEEPGGLHSMGSRRVRHDWASTHVCYMCQVAEYGRKEIMYNWSRVEGFCRGWERRMEVRSLGIFIDTELGTIQQSPTRPSLEPRNVWRCLLYSYFHSLSLGLSISVLSCCTNFPSGPHLL